jgi:hypothetical protein
MSRIDPLESKLLTLGDLKFESLQHEKWVKADWRRSSDRVNNSSFDDPCCAVTNPYGRALMEDPMKADLEIDAGSLRDRFMFIGENDLTTPTGS